jgi:hypothetical protein
MQTREGRKGRRKPQRHGGTDGESTTTKDTKHTKGGVKKGMRGEEWKSEGQGLKIEN